MSSSDIDKPMALFGSDCDSDPDDPPSRPQETRSKIAKTRAKAYSKTETETPTGTDTKTETKVETNTGPASIVVEAIPEEIANFAAFLASRPIEEREALCIQALKEASKLAPTDRAEAGFGLSELSIDVWLREFDKNGCPSKYGLIFAEYEYTKVGQFLKLGRKSAEDVLHELGVTPNDSDRLLKYAFSG
jgi:hypothetical protein